MVVASVAALQAGQTSWRPTGAATGGDKPDKAAPSRDQYTLTAG